MQHDHSNNNIIIIMATLLDISNHFLEILLPIKMFAICFLHLAIAGTLPFTNVGAGASHHKISRGGGNPETRTMGLLRYQLSSRSLSIRL